ncbi:methyl-accepting chemotaxis protein [Marinomonas sp. 5E14-1]|uniref:methyl-accepting chemotaxis protein n=1 Tax=Marinomonas sp. 5E14-1 TaxID=3153922 RepID=UPI00326659C9
MKIKTKLLIGFSIAIVLPVLTVSSITAFLSSKSALKDFSQNSSQTLSAVESTYDQFISDIKNVVGYISKSDAITAIDARPLTTYTSKEGKAPSVVAKQNGGREEEIFKMFEGLGKNHSHYVYVYMGDLDGGYLEWPGTYEYAEFYTNTQSWYMNSLKKPGEIIVNDAYYWEPDDAAYLSVISTYQKGNEIGGMVSIDVSIKTLTEMARNTKLGNTGSVMVIENTGTILADPLHEDNNFKKINEVEGEAYQVIANTSDGMAHFHLDGIDYYANVYTSPNLQWKFVGLMPAEEIYASTNELIKTTIIVCVLLLIAFSIIVYFMAKALITPIENVSSHLQVLAEGEGDLTSKIEINTNDETGTLANWFNQFVESTCKLILGIKNSSVEIDHIAAETAAKANEVAESTVEQLKSLELISEAGRQMVLAASEGAESCAQSAEFSEKGLETTIAGKKLIQNSSEGVNSLGERLAESNGMIKELEKETDNINQILSTIQGIAEQTNLLALNAAIEAARAGEQGRGFAVVADEVRTLAGRTQESTEQITSILGLLSNKTKEASDSMMASLSESENAISLSNQALESFVQIEDVVKQMRDMTMQTAASAEEQRAVTEDINSNIINISESAHNVSSISGDVASLCEKQDHLSKELHSMVVRFRTE